MSQACVKISQNRIHDLLTHAALDTPILLILRKLSELRLSLGSATLSGIVGRISWSRGLRCLDGYSTLHGFFVVLAMLRGSSTALTALIAPFLH